MNRSSQRMAALVAALATGAALALVAPGAAVAAKPGGDKPGNGTGPLQTVQLLSFNDYHGHIQSPDVPVTTNPANKFYGLDNLGGGEYLSSMLTQLRANAPKGRTLTVAAGDLIGGTPFLSGLFHDEPSVESLDAMHLDVSSVGNHEFDEGTTELLRMQNGGCHPVDGCYFPEDPYPGADFEWLAANVVKNDGSGTLLPGTTVKKIDGMKIGFIGMTLEETPTLVSPTGVTDVTFLDEVETANAEAAKLQQMGVQAIVVLLHEGGLPTGGGIGDCVGVSNPIATIAAGMAPSIDAIVTGHTHQPYVCSMADPAGNPRLVTSAASFGRVVTETNLVIDRRTGDVDRAATTATNHMVIGVQADPAITDIVAKWNTIAAPLAGRVVGTITADITGDATSTNRTFETPMADLVADAILYATEAPEDGGAQISLMNVGGVRDSLIFSEITNGEQPGEVTYAESFNVNPFNNLIVTISLTGAQLEAALNQQYIATRSRPTLALGVSEGFTYTWDPVTRTVVSGSMSLNGVPLAANTTYRVSMYNFLADGGDSFTAFRQGTDRTGGPEDLEAFVEYMEDHSPVAPPADRVNGI